ncbi:MULTISPECIES: RNA polymerase sigma factor [Bacillaceae]|uniref:RNA polymerase sigma factor n=1 Tax=Evansella alkalicola TaxID=745819 RepID=A0ABS6JQD3_9BACI|nr:MULTISPECIES: RNA polymerase sigma factor [Bacillaceae]MBU9720776.1 RNA polymerase sigma factor [Bacillus alkalicola]
MPELNDRVLIQETLRGNDEAFQELIDEYHLTVERFARQIGIREEDLPDVTQEVFIKVYRFLDKYSRGKFTTWLYSVTLNVAKDFFRKQKREKRKLEKTIQENPEQFYQENLDLTEDAKILHETISQMDEKYRIPIVLFYFHDSSIKDIAAIMSMRESSVKTRLKRGKSLLKKSLEEGGYIYEPRAL